jgi:hypothetical protein
MKLRTLLKRYRAQAPEPRGALPFPNKPGTPQRFQPLTKKESKAILEDAIVWLMVEARIVLAMPNGTAKERCKAELRARGKSLARDYDRLVRTHEG